MARIEQGTFRQYVDGRDRMTAQEYMRDREVFRQSINDLEDKYLITDDIQQQFIDTNSELNQTKQEVSNGVAQLTLGIVETNKTFQEAQTEISNISEQAVQEVQTEVQKSITSFRYSVEEARQLATETKEAAREIIAELGPYTGEWDDGNWDDGTYYVDIDGGGW